MRSEQERLVVVSANKKGCYLLVLLLLFWKEPAEHQEQWASLADKMETKKRVFPLRVEGLTNTVERVDKDIDIFKDLY